MKTLIATACVALCFLLTVPGAEASEKAVMVSPASGSTLTSSTVDFQWTAGSGVSDHWLYLGTTIGGNELYDHNFGSGLSTTVTGLPTNGIRIYARLWSAIGATWEFHDSSFIAYSASASAPAEMTTPAPGSRLTASAVEFHWNGGSNVLKYWLYAGTSVGGHNLFDQDRGTSLSATVMGLPADESTIYIRLWSFIGTAWQWRDYTYTATGQAATALAQMATPAPSSTLTSSTVTFQWTGGMGASEYRLEVGSAAGGHEFFDQAVTSLSATVSPLPTNGSRLYVRLWSHFTAGWQYNDYTYIAASSVPARAEMTTPAPSSTLTSSTVTFQWTGGTGASEYWLDVASGGRQFFNQTVAGLSATVSGLPTDGSTVNVRLFSHFTGGWQYYDYTYTALSSAPAKAQMTTPAPSSTLTSSAVTFQWTGGTGASEYWLDVGSSAGGHEFFTQAVAGLSATVSPLPTNGSTLYVRLWSHFTEGWQSNEYTYTAYTAASSTPVRAQMTTPAPSSTLTSSTVTFQWTGGTGASDYWLEVGSGGRQFFNQAVAGLSATVSGLPTDGSTVNVRLFSHFTGGWQYYDYTYTASSSTPAKAQMIAPAPSSTLTSSTVTFQWTGGTAVLDYWLEAGPALHVYQFYSQATTSLSATVSGLPTNGSTVHVRLWSHFSTGWQYYDYTYTASTAP